MFITKLWNKEKQKPKIEVIQDLDLIEDMSDEDSATVSGGGMRDGFTLSPFIPTDDYLQPDTSFGAPIVLLPIHGGLLIQGLVLR